LNLGVVECEVSIPKYATPAPVCALVEESGCAALETGRLACPRRLVGKAEDAGLSLPEMIEVVKDQLYAIGLR